MITDVFPPYVVYITAFDALIALPFLYRSYRVQEVLTEFRSGLHILLFQYFRLVCLTAGRGDDSFALAWRMARCLTGVYAMALATSSAPPPPPFFLRFCHRTTVFFFPSHVLLCMNC